jgi:hypothetical protein
MVNQRKYLLQSHLLVIEDTIVFGQCNYYTDRVLEQIVIFNSYAAINRN